MKMDLFTKIMIVVIPLALIFSFFMFKNCYDDHRNQLNFSVWTSIASCSG